MPRYFKIRWLPVALLTLLALGMAGCSSGSTVLTGTSWPGITLSNNVVYASYGKVYALDPQSGEVKWSFPAQPAGGQTFYATPAVADNLVVVADYVDSLYALKPETGEQLWTFKSNGSRFIGGAVIGEKFVYAASVDGIVHALDRETGNEAWTYTAGGSIWSTPLLADGVLYVTSLDRHLYALDAQSGALSWEFPLAGSEEGDPPTGAIADTPLLYNGVLYFGSFNNHVYALSAETHQVLWTYPTTNWVWSSPIVDEQSKLLIGADLDGHVFALDPQTGAPAWTYDTHSPVVGAPLIGQLEDGTRVIYITAGGDPNLFILNLSDGKENVRPITVTAEFTTTFIVIPTGTDTRPIPIYSSPVLADNLILLGAHQGSDMLYALDRQTYQEKWAFNPTAYEKQQQAAQQQGQPTSFFNSPIFNIVLVASVAFLMLSLLRRPGQKK